MAYLLSQWQLFGWKPDLSLSVDENFMDLTLIITRSSKLRQGGMACVLVDTEDAESDKSADCILDRIICVSTNQSLYNPDDSDIHAEIVALGQAAKAGRSTNGACAYITMPPCKKCFGALLSSGVARIVSRKMSPLLQVATKHGIELVTLNHEQDQQAKRRIANLVEGYWKAKSIESNEDLVETQTHRD